MVIVVARFSVAFFVGSPSISVGYLLSKSLVLVKESLLSPSPPLMNRYVVEPRVLTRVFVP